MIDPLYVTARNVLQDSDVVTVITIHSAKGTDRDVCYVLNVSPQAFPTSFAIGNSDKVEEERRVLYVALTRAKNELIIRRHCPSGNGGFTLWARTNDSPDDERPETYFFNALPENMIGEHVHQQAHPLYRNGAPEAVSGFMLALE